MTKEQMNTLTLNEVSDGFRDHRFSREEAEAYVKLWNASGKHETIAKVYAFSIGNAKLKNNS